MDFYLPQEVAGTDLGRTRDTSGEPWGFSGEIRTPQEIPRLHRGTVTPQGNLGLLMRNRDTSGELGHLNLVTSGEPDTSGKSGTP